MMTKARVKSPPQIWCLTGLIELNDATAATVTERNHTVNIGLSSAMAAMLSGAPVGASIELGNNTTIKCELKWPGTSVWAAQYQLIRTRATLIVEDDETPPINYVTLYPDYTYAKGRVLGDDDEEEDAFLLEPSAESCGVDCFNEEYWKLYAEAEERGRRQRVF